MSPFNPFSIGHNMHNSHLDFISPLISDNYQQSDMKKQRTQISQSSQFDQSPNSELDNTYIAHLKSQCAIRYNALKTAQNLISAYQKENDSLKFENLQLKERLQALEQRLEEVSVMGEEVETLEKTVLKYSQRINELLEKQMDKDRRIADLEKELRLIGEKAIRLKEGEEQRQRRKEKEQRRRRQGEQKFNNFLKLPLPEDSFSSIASLTSQQKQQIRVLSLQVKKKDEEILALLRRVRDVEDDAKAMHRKDRLKTSDTVINNSIRKNTYSSIEE